MSEVLIERSGDGVATVTLNRPEKRNALSMAMRDQVIAGLADLAGDNEVKVVIVTGAGDAFCAGFDLKEFQALAVGEIAADVFWDASERWHKAWLEFPLPTLAALKGPALGGGFDLAVMCDLRVAAEGVRLAHPEHTFSDVVYTPLLDLVGSAIAKELVLTGRSVDAEEALRLHLVSAVVPYNRLVGEARRYAAMIAEAPRDALERAKAKANRRAAAVVDGRLDL
jgi:enoyl-CoA hydratase/carnithine racemase